MGNTRVTYTSKCDNGNITLSTQTALDYYPYGKELRAYNSGGEKYKSTYNERDKETNYDFRNARSSAADVVRFNSVDPMASKYPSLSGYSYVGGNPVILIDPQGETIQISYTDDEGEERYVKYEYGEKYNGNNQFVANIFAQLDYLMTNSPFETNIVAAIANDKNFEWTIAQITEVAFFKPVGNKSLADGITTMGGVGAASARTTYYEFVGFKTNEGGFQSPISTLYHEAGHAYIKLQQYQLGRQGLMTLDAILDQADYYGKKDNAKFLDNEEEFVNNTYEAPMAHYMGEGIRTSDYGSTVYKTANLFTPLPSTFIGPIAPPIGYFK